MNLVQINDVCVSVRALCTDRFALMPCVRKYLHEFDATALIHEVHPKEILSDPHLFCTTYADCEDVNGIVQRFLEAK